MCSTYRPAIRLWFSMLLPILVLCGCAHDAINIREIREARKSLAPVDLVTISAVHVENKDGVLQVAITGSKPFSYSINNHDTPPSIRVDVHQAQFVGLPALLTVGQGGVKTINLSKVPGQEGTARLEIQLEEQAAYSVAKEQERLFVRIRPPQGVPSPLTSPGQPAAPPDPEGVPSLPPSSLLQPAAPPTLPPSSQDYRIGSRDVLAITVYDEPDLSKKLRVSEGGAISFPLVGSMQVQGFTPTQVEEKLAHLLSQGYLLNPQVFVEVAEFESQKVFILGAIEKPINFTLRGQTTLLELLSQTGKLGRGEGGGQSSSLVVFRQVVTKDAQDRPVDKEVKTIRIDLDRLLRQGDMSLNLVLQAHDVIYVPAPDSVFVFGQVSKPGPLSLPDGSMTLVEAVSKAGGFTHVAAPNRTRIFRVVDGEEQTIYVNVSDIIKRGDRSKDVVLKANDIVWVPESLF